MASPFEDPHHIAVVSRSIGYRTVARQGDEPRFGHIMVPAKSPIGGMADPAGQEIAFPPPTAFERIGHAFGAEVLPAGGGGTTGQ